MAQLSNICQFLDKELNISEIQDASQNGLQVEGKQEVKKMVFAVDASLDTFEEAHKRKADMVIVHHGLFWDKPQPLTGILYQRLQVLFKHQISLYAAHLPVDIHSKIGHNAQLMNFFVTKKRETFGNYHGVDIGFLGFLHRETTLSTVVAKLEESLNTKCQVLAFGGEKIKTIAVVSGGAAELVAEAVDKKVDLFITGESKLSSYYIAKEGKINVIFAGHYATETLGM
ncbi:Nif3-like dinuclear metal center hexameric protein, partial [Candidatus Desantisbacteria bacterium]|nr:Nif3-like dinuclear metal center hexameric protein [Candidatus Desantisbacteria bacterium]